MKLKFINSTTKETLKVFTDQLWNVVIDKTIGELEKENNCKVSCIESFTIYEVLNHGLFSAFEDQEIEITELDKTLNFEEIRNDQSSYNTLTQSLRMFEEIESYLSDDDIKVFFTSVFRRPLSFNLVQHAFTNYLHLIDDKMMLSLLTGYNCYQIKYFEGKYDRKPLKCQHDNFMLNHEYENNLQWVYDNHKELLDQGIQLRIEDLKKYDNYLND